MIATRGLILAGALVSMTAGCANVTSSVAGQTTVNGEAWYVRTTGIFGLVFSADVFYCPSPSSQGPATCTQAKMYGVDDPYTAPAVEAVEEPEEEEANEGEATDEPAQGEAETTEAD